MENPSLLLGWYLGGSGRTWHPGTMTNKGRRKKETQSFPHGLHMAYGGLRLSSNYGNGSYSILELILRRGRHSQHPNKVEKSDLYVYQLNLR
jgi:hypothetical protein